MNWSIKFAAFLILYHSGILVSGQHLVLNNRLTSSVGLSSEEMEHSVEYSNNKLRGDQLILPREEGQVPLAQFGLRHLPNDDPNVYLTYTHSFRNSSKRFEFGWSVNNHRCMTLTLIKSTSRDR